jgi:hypothetical protein
VRAIAFAPSGRHALSAAPSERSVAVWNTSGSKKAKKLGGVAVAALALEDPAVSLATAAAPGCSEDGAFYAAAVTEAGEALVWLCLPEGEAAVVAVPAARVRVGGTKAAAGSGGMANGDAVLAAALEVADNGGCFGAAAAVQSLAASFPAWLCTLPCLNSSSTLAARRSLFPHGSYPVPLGTYTGATAKLVQPSALSGGCPPPPGFKGGAHALHHLQPRLSPQPARTFPAARARRFSYSGAPTLHP